jgi:hypothetical protein
MFRIGGNSGRALLVAAVWLTAVAAAASKPHAITIGKWMSVPWLTGADENKAVALKVRPLYVDGRMKEYIVGGTHEVTDRLFVVRRAFRVNDSLPEDSGGLRWQWQRGGWLAVDRMTGHVSTLNLPEFDTYYSAASWYRDYVAYCGVSDDGQRLYAIVAQVSRHKPVLKKSLAGQSVGDEAAADSACLLPTWQRTPVRVTFELAGGTKLSFVIRGHTVDSVDDAEEDEASK